MGLIVAETEGETQTGIQFTASTSNLDNFEQYDLGAIPIGLTGDEDSYTKCLRIVNSSFEKIVPNYIQVNGAGTNFNITSLLCEEYMSPQLVPLKIIEGDYYLNDFSAIKCIVLDGEKYVFSQGTLKAASDTISGSWYKIEATSEVMTTVEEETFEPDTDPPNPPNPHDPTGADSSLKISNINNQHSYNLNNIVKFNSIGIIGSEISGTGITSVTIIEYARGKLYDNQKLLLTLSDGSEPVILVKDGASTTSDKILDIDSFNPSVTYHAGSVLSMLEYDLTNVITGGSSTPNLYQGVTETAIYLTPQQFHTTNDSNMVIYTRDDLGSVQGTEYSRKIIYATTFIPLGYKVTTLDVYSSANRSIEIKTSRTINDATTSRGTGTSNTTMILSGTGWTSVEGDYVILIYNSGAISDEIYGAKITIQAI